MLHGPAMTPCDSVPAASSVADLNARFAATVQRKIHASGSPRELRFAALEEALADLFDVVRVCNEHHIAFDQFAAFDSLLFGPESELDEFETSYGAHIKNDDLEPGAGLMAPLEGERGGYVHLLNLKESCTADTMLFVAVGKYFLLFERPLPALGAFRAAWRAAPKSCAAADGVAYCLLLLGLREEATMPLALTWWENVQPPLGDAAAASSFLATLTHVVREPPKAAAAILRNASRFLCTRAVSAARRLLRQWLPAWLGFDGTAVLLRELGDADGWLGSALVSSNVFACAALEPVLTACRRQVLTSLLAASGGASPASDAIRRLGTAAASIACHMLTVGFCVAEEEEEARAVDAARAALATGAAGTRLRAAAVAGDAAIVEDAALLMAVAMYRPLALVAKGLQMDALEASTLVAVPRADHAFEMHLCKPRERRIRAEALPRVTPFDDASMHVEAFYRTTLYPVWHVPETGDAPRTTIGACLRRHYPTIAWPFDDAGANPLRLCVAGAGSGHHVAQAALTLSHCEVVALDLSAASLAYAEDQMARLLPEEASRVSWVVGDLMRLGDEAGASGGGDASTCTADGATAEHFHRHIASKFHLIMCFGVVHHCADPAVALGRLAATLLPGGVLQLGTYSTFGVRSWRPAARWLLHRINPEVVREDGELVRQPTAAELRAIRARVFELAKEPSAESEGGADADDSVRTLSRECATARMLTLFDEYYSHSGALDLLFHPQEASFTLLQLRTMLAAAKLEAVGVFFLDAAQDRQARRSYREAGGADAEQCDLAMWHRLEERDPTTFGRMHVVYCRLRCSNL